MPALPVLSVEVWQMILRSSISITGFLDPDAFEGDLEAYGFGDADDSRNDEAIYWESERARNTLQRVCKAWDSYLRRFEHRYVRMADIRYRRIDKKSIKRAIRISFYDNRCACREVCSCSVGRKWGGWSNSMPANEIFSQFCCETVLGLHDLPAEMIDIDGALGASLWNAGGLRSLKELKVVIAGRIYGDMIALPLFSQTPSLKHIYGDIYEQHHQPLQFISHNLVTFSLTLSREENYETLILDLPALRHLRIDFGGGKIPSMTVENILVPFFGKVGGQLRSLYWNHRYQMPVEIWERCPHLEIFHPGIALPASPLVLHRVHTLSVREEGMPQTLKLQWPNLRRLILHERWFMLNDRKQSEFFTLWADKLQGSGVTFEDSEGIALESDMKTRGLI